MELEGMVHNGVVVLDDATALPEGTRVRISPAPAEKPKPFGERFAKFRGAVPDLPTDLAEQHDHYRLGNAEANEATGTRTFSSSIMSASPLLPVTFRARG